MKNFLINLKNCPHRLNGFLLTISIQVLSFLLLFLFSFPLLAQSSLEKRLDFTVAEESLPDALWRLSEISEVPIVFSDDFFPPTTLNQSFVEKPLGSILKSLLKSTNTTYEFDGSQVLILKKEIIKNYTISGYLEDKETGEQLIGATIMDLRSGKGTVTNAYGFFSLTLPSGDKGLQFSYLGYQPVAKVLQLNQDHQLNIQLNPSLTLHEVVVTDSLSQQNMLEDTDGEKLFSHLIDFLSPLGGEPDILRAVQQLPGVQSGVDGFGGLHVRGGNADQNLVLLDGVRIYNPFHAVGLFSIFDNAMVRKVDYYRGQFPARFGGRISSVVDVRTKEGNNKEYHGEASIGLIASKITLEGPLKKNKGAFLLSARRTHLDPFIKRYSQKERSENDESGFYNFYFGEIMGKLNYSISPKDRIYLSFYKGTDDFENEKGTTETYEMPDAIVETLNKQAHDWGNTLGVLRWNHQLGKKLFSNVTLNYSVFQFRSNDVYSYEEEEPGNDEYKYSQNTAYQSRIENVTGRLDFHYALNPEHFLRAGLMFSRQHFSPGITSLRDSIQDGEFEEALLDSLLTPTSIKNQEYSIYLEDEWRPLPKLVINAGIYNALYAVTGKNYFLSEPRLSVNWNFKPRFLGHASVSKTGQFLHVLTNLGVGLPNDLWVPSTQNVRPQQAWVYDFGLDFSPAENWLLESNFYYKKMRHLLSYRENENILSEFGLITSVDWEAQVTAGEGTSYGMEWTLKKTKGKTKVWISYTWSETTRQFEEINNGQPYPYRFDLRHVLNLNFSQQLGKRWAVSSSWNYSSGSKISLATRRWEYVDQDGYPLATFIDYNGIASYQLPAYHQLDVRGQFIQPTRWGQWSLLLGVYNAYNRRNLVHINSEYNFFTGEQKYIGVSLIPVLPYFSFNVKI